MSKVLTAIIMGKVQEHVALSGLVIWGVGVWLHLRVVSLLGSEEVLPGLDWYSLNWVSSLHVQQIVVTLGVVIVEQELGGAGQESVIFMSNLCFIEVRTLIWFAYESFQIQ